jgi:hypothetical protein
MLVHDPAPQVGDGGTTGGSHGVVAELVARRSKGGPFQEVMDRGQVSQW